MNQHNAAIDGASGDADTVVTLDAAAERVLIRPTGGARHVQFTVRVAPAPPQVDAGRTPLTLAVVLDRSGSMSGDKIATAKAATSTLLDRLDARDRFALVVFDDEIDLLQPLTPVTPTLRSAVRAALAGVDARASTALHEGWLTGCRAIVDAAADSEALPRCFLLTDGQANVGVTDPEEIAADVAGIRRNAGIGTSTFGIGDDYDETLLGPMAVAGEGQFHHLRSVDEIARTFVGELGALMGVAVRRVRLELAFDSGTSADVISAYDIVRPAAPGEHPSIPVGDLLHGDERHVVVRFRFHAQDGLAGRTVRARVAWEADGQTWRGPWREIHFTYASHGDCNQEARNAEVMHWVGLHHAERAKRRALLLNRQGDFAGGARLLERVAERIRDYAGDDADLQATVAELSQVRQIVGIKRMAAPAVKEMYFQSQLRTRGQVDYRKPGRRNE